MSFKYINPGYSAFLDAEGVTVEGSAYNPAHGAALYQPTDNAGVDISATMPISTRSSMCISRPLRSCR